MFLLMFKGGLNFDKPEFTTGKFLNNLGYYNERNLPSNGIGPFFYSLLCVTHDSVKYEDLHTHKFENSRFFNILSDLKEFSILFIII